MSEAVIVPILLMMTSTVSEESLAMDYVRMHARTHTHIHTHPGSSTLKFAHTKTTTKFGKQNISERSEEHLYPAFMNTFLRLTIKIVSTVHPMDSSFTALVFFSVIPCRLCAHCMQHPLAPLTVGERGISLTVDSGGHYSRRTHPVHAVSSLDQRLYPHEVQNGAGPTLGATATVTATLSCGTATARTATPVTTTA